MTPAATPANPSPSIREVQQSMAAEITLADLLAWVPRLRAPGSNLPRAVADAGDESTYSDRNDLDRELTWAVTVRASSPMLPPLRGGELVLLPRRVLAESGVSLPSLLRELALHRCCGVVLDGVPSGTAPLPVLVSLSVGPDFENEINRLLTQRRGELYRSGTELEHLLSDLTNAGAEAGQALTAIARQLSVTVSVADRQGNGLLSSSAEAAPSFPPTYEGGWHRNLVALPVSDGRIVWIGPVPQALRALMRLVGERVATAVDSSLLRTSQARPRGPARALALQSLILGSATDPLTRAAALGLPADSRYRVALASPVAGTSGLLRSLGSLGTVHDASTLDGLPIGLIEIRPDPRRSTTDARRGTSDAGRGTPILAPPGEGWLAVSGPATNVSQLADALREARFVAALLHAELIAGPIGRFDALGDLGAYRLLFRLWGTSDLTAFAAEALGSLPARDRKGTLRRTLLVYLEAGGSHVDAAQRLEIHRNTLAYRLRQIGELTGSNPTDADTRLVLHLALLAMSLPPAP